MKKRNYIIVTLMISASLAFTSCNKSSAPENVNIAGVYNGSITISPSLKSAIVGGASMSEGVAEVTMNNDHQIQVRCFGKDLDTTFMLNYYANNDSIMVCLTGEDFEDMYGHMPGDGHMGGGMMGNIRNGETEWMHHMNNEHKPGDPHFGGFNIKEGTFTYSFGMMDGSTPYHLEFNGTKK